MSWLIKFVTVLEKIVYYASIFLPPIKTVINHENNRIDIPSNRPTVGPVPEAVQDEGPDATGRTL